MRLLDLFSCAGGAAVGYHRAGFEVVGVDIQPQPRYPFEFHQADALAFAAEHAHEFDVIHASPPCQVYSATANAHTSEHPDLLAPTRELLQSIGKPYIIENVERAPLIDPVMLCGTMFGLSAPDVDGVELQLQRHRLFETSFPVAMAPSPCAHDSRPVGGSYKGARRRTPEDRDQKRRGGYTPALSVRAALLGIDWMNMRDEHELAQAIPPAYTEWLGGQLLDALVPSHGNGSQGDSECRICHHAEAAHTRRLTSKRHGFTTKRACAECACVEFVEAEVCGMCISPYVQCTSHTNRSDT